MPSVRALQENILFTKTSSSVVSLSAGSVVTIGGQQYRLQSASSLTLSGLSAGSLYMVYAVTSGVSVVLVTSLNMNSVGPSGYSAWKLVGALYADSSTTLGSLVNIDGAPTTDWITYTPLWTAPTTNPAIGNGILTGKWRRVGDSVYVQILMNAGTTTTYGSNYFNFSIPSGMTVDTTKIGYTTTGNMALGHVQGFISGTSGYTGEAVYQYTTNTFQITGNQGSPWRSDSPAVWNANTSTNIYLNILAPISSWTNVPLKSL